MLGIIVGGTACALGYLFQRTEKRDPRERPGCDRGSEAGEENREKARVVDA